MAIDSRFTPSSVSNTTVIPAYLGNQMPNPIQVAPSAYENIDPLKLLQQFGSQFLDQYLLNNRTAQTLGLGQLETELKGLKGFAPEAAALKRQQLTIDNLFNQRERTAQVNSALPNARGDLASQRERALAYASGNLPNAEDQAAAELQRGSDAADLASRGGFGSSSSVARKASALLSVKERTALSQYGDQLLNSNLSTEANLFLAPTSYSNAGQSINVTPEIGAGRAASAFGADLNARNNLDIPTVLNTKIQQNQWNTGRLDNINNANVNTANQANQLRFQYDSTYAAAVAGAIQTGINTEVSLSQQAEARQTFLQYMQQAQKNQDAQAWAQLAGTILGIGANVVTGMK